jgi:hypothetical protein
MARKPANPIKVVTPLVRTVKPPYMSEVNDVAVPGWDSTPGMAQHAKRISITEPGGTIHGPGSDHPAVPSNHPHV